MADKKPDTNAESPEQKALEQHVDEMMSVEKKPSTDVAKLAEDFNKQALSSEAVSGKIEVKVGPPELPEKLKVVEKPDILESQPAPVAIPEIEVTEDVPQEPKPANEFDDQATEEAVDDIVAKEGDTVLAVEDAKRKKATAPVSSGDWKSRAKIFFKDKRIWAVAAVLLVAIFAVPVTRYKILGLVIKKDVTVTIVDNITNSPVSNAEVRLAGGNATTDEDGRAKLRAGVGSHNLVVTKKYYTDYGGDYFVGFHAKAGQNIKFVATGRLVPVKVINKITGKPLVGAQLEVKGTTAKTNNKGQAEVALPVKEKTYKGKLKLGGFNAIEVTIQVTNKTVKENSFGLVPSGQIYFLSNINGSIDVVKSNLDGSSRKTVLDGTGNEQSATTSLLASRDWRFVVLKARRDTAQPALYLIDTSNDKVTPFDNSDADFSLVGWYGHSFIYSLTRNTIPYWQSGKQAVKSYDADHLQPNQLDQNQGEGSQASYAYQNFLNFYILNGVLTYNTEWNTYAMDSAGKNDTIRAIQPNGQNKKDYQTFATATTGYIQATLYEPQSVYYAVYDNSANKINYFEFGNLAVKSVNLDSSAFDQGYPTFLLSPSGNKTFWTELRDGKNALFIGGANADSKKQIASLSEYSPYGWYGDSYVLVSKNSSELYIMSPNASTEPPLKITDYFKPTQTFQGYGYGYGGL